MTGRFPPRPSLELGVALGITLCGSACREAVPPGPAAEALFSPHFSEVSRAAGLDFEHRNGGTGERYMMETLGSGGGFLDYDLDGNLDIYLVQSGLVPGAPTAAETDGQHPATNRLFRNAGDGTFRDVTAESGLGDSGYGMGSCFGDVDNDGQPDVYVTNFGTNRLYRNRGDGTFDDITEVSAAGNPRWSASCAFGDYDQDGWLDLYVVNYVEYTIDTHRLCGNPDFPTYCPPDAYPGAPDTLYRNLGGGRFEDATAAAGILEHDPSQGKGLGVVWGDYDDDGDLDIYVANDATPNYLHRNNGDGTFTEIGVLAGAAFSELGVPEAGMGVDAGDTDADGDLDLFVTHLDLETNTLYRNRGGGIFEDQSNLSGLGPASLLDLGFGTGFADFDNDGDLDAFVANGHLNDLVAYYNPSQTYEQKDRLYINRGDGSFSDTSEQAGAYFGTARVGRGAALADFDNDGDVDILVCHNNQPVALLENDSTQTNNWIGLRLVSGPGRADAVGARLEVVAAGRRFTREIRAGSGYLSQSDLRLLVGLGDADTIDSVSVRWPDGSTESLDGADFAINQYHTLDQSQIRG
jgi:hypothetical protein